MKTQATLKEEAIDRAYAQALSKIDEQHRSRLERGLAILRNNEVVMRNNGAADIHGYAVTGKTCTCPDFTYGKAAGLCKHIAAFGLFHRSRQQLQHLQRREGYFCEMALRQLADNRTRYQFGQTYDALDHCTGEAVSYYAALTN